MSKDEMTTSGSGAFMLFGVRVVVDSMRKSVSLNNLSQYQHRLDVGKEVVQDVVAGYVSADDVVRQTSSVTTTTVVNRERKRGVPWTEEEHKLFLLGLEKVGKGDWRGISRNFVKTRTPTQVASHAQKHFIRQSNVNRRRRRRSSLFDITTTSVAANLMNDDHNITGVESQHQEVAAASIQACREMSNVDLTVSSAPQAVAATTSRSNKAMMEFDLNSNADMDMNTSVFSFDPSPLSLNLSLSLSTGMAKASSSKNSTFQVMQRCGNSDGMISVA